MTDMTDDLHSAMRAADRQLDEVTAQLAACQATVSELESKANALFTTADQMTALATKRGDRIAALESSLVEQRRISVRLSNERDQYRRDFAAMSDRAAELACKVSELERERDGAKDSAALTLSAADFAVAERFVSWAVDDLEAADDPAWAPLFEGAAVVRRLLAARGGPS